MRRKSGVRSKGLSLGRMGWGGDFGWNFYANVLVKELMVWEFCSFLNLVMVLSSYVS